MSERKAYEALSSKSRLQILKLLNKRQLSVIEIAKSVNLQPITVRHHLQLLEEAGFIEGYERKSGTVGRPKVQYMTAKNSKLVSYPKRHYLSLSNFMIDNIQSFLGSSKAIELFNKIGKNMGESVVQEIESEYNVKDWSLETFRNFFVNGYLEEAGAEPEIVEVNKNRIVYRVHNCQFLELAIKIPEIMCEVLHEAFHEGVSTTLGGKVKITRLTCMGHGDPYCGHECIWYNGKERNPA